MLLTPVTALPDVAWADDEVDLDTVTMAYSFYDFLYVRTSTEALRYNEDLFRKDSLEFSNQLALMSLKLNQTTFRIDYAEPENQAIYIGRLLEDLGYSDVELNEDFTSGITSGDTVCAACAHKTIIQDGKPYTLLVILTRGATYDNEWQSNMFSYPTPDYKGDNAGYSKCKDKILDFTKDYISDHEISGDIKVWTTGYSRGAGIIDLLGADLIRNPRKALGNSVKLQPRDVFCYTFGTPNVASISGDYKDSKYDRIHNVFDSGDISASLPPSAGFARYGTQYVPYYPYGYGYQPKKLDTEALRNGEVKVIDDDASYLPEKQSDYVQALTDGIAEFMVRESKSGNGAEAYCDIYQEPILHFMEWSMENGLGSVAGMSDMSDLTFLTESQYTVPMMLSMYITFMIDKSIRDGSDLGDLLMSAYKMLWSMLEDENGEVTGEYGEVLNEYNDIVTQLYSNMKGKGNRSSNNPFKSLSVKLKKELLSFMRGVTATLYADVLREAMEKDGTDPETIALLTSKEDSYAMSWLMTNLLLGNSAQDDENDFFSLDNQQFKQFATLYSNYNALIMPHFYSMMSWGLRTREDNIRAGTAARTGYRCVEIKQPEGVSVSGIVTDAEGNTVAEFKDGKLLSRTNIWIGITASDIGYWLRLPIDNEYHVSIVAEEAATIGLNVSEYSIREGRVVRSIGDESSRDWNAIAFKKGESAEFTLPKIERTESGFILPSEAEYVSELPQIVPSAPADEPVSTEIYSSAIPKVKKFKVSAGSHSFKASWTKLSSKKRKKFSKIELQYSSNKDFSGETTVTKTLKKTKKGYKVKKLKKGSVYYVRARDVRYKNGKKYVSGWTKSRRVKVR